MWEEDPVPNESSVPRKKMGSRVLTCVDIIGLDGRVLQRRCAFRKDSASVNVEMKGNWEIPEIWHLERRERQVF